MLKMRDFSQCELSMRAYGGAAGRKLGIVVDNENYILKFPGNLKERNLKNVRLSYSNGPVSEYIGSHIYESIGIPVHQTELGTYGGKLVVACKDFLGENERLYEFEKLKVTFVPRFLDSNGNETNGTGSDLQEVLLTIKEHPWLSRIPGVEERFWNMFVVDALIGNPDRNNGNWGIIVSQDDNMRLAPVYDNGNCLNDKWDEEKMKGVMENDFLFQNEAYKGKICIYELNKHMINPFQLIGSKKYEGCNKAIGRIVPRINMNKISEIIDEIPELNDVSKKYYKKVIGERYHKVLLPICQQLMEMKQVLYMEQ